MASRQNREAREKTNGSSRPKQRSFGAPMGPPPVRDTSSERDRLLATKPTSEEVRSAVEADEEGSREETRARAENEAANRRTAAPRSQQTSGTDDLSARGAGERISGRQRQIDEEVERQSRGEQQPD